MTNWPTIIADLRSLGWRLIDIAAEIDQEEYWVSRVARGFTRKVDYDTGRKLLALHAREIRQSVVSRGTQTQLQVGGCRNT